MSDIKKQEQSGGDEPSAKKAQMPVRSGWHGAEMVGFMKQVIVEQADGIAKVFIFLVHIPVLNIRAAVP